MNKKHTNIVKSKAKILADPKFKAQVQGAMDTIDTFGNMLMQSDEDMDSGDAKKAITQMFYTNYKWTEDPVQAAKYLLAKSMTYQQLMEKVDPEQALLDIDGQSKLLKMTLDTIKLLDKMKPAQLQKGARASDDEIFIKNPDWKEAEVVSER